jgi:hypothetical protein
VGENHSQVHTHAPVAGASAAATVSTADDERTRKVFAASDYAHSLPPFLSAEPINSGSSASVFVSAKQGYQIAVPAGWELKGKAGADSLWEDPSRRLGSPCVSACC